MSKSLHIPMNIPILRIPFSEADKEFIRDGMNDILDSGYLTMGKYTQAFEEGFSEFTGSRYCVAVSNGTAALEIILRALEIEGQSVVVPTNTYMATAFAVLHSGNRVIFADSDPETLCLDLTDVTRRITEDTGAIILVHIGGVISPQVYALKRLCDERGLYLIEDCAHAHGCTLDGKQAGTFGMAGAFSFFPTKVITTGEGGMITTDDEDIYRRAMVIRNHGKNPGMGNRMSDVGHNQRMSEFTALLGVQQMRKAHQMIQERNQIARFYDATLRDVDSVRPLALPDALSSSYYKYIAYLDEELERSALKRVTKEKYGVSLSGEVYADPCHTQPVWERYTYCGRRRNGVDPSCVSWPNCGCSQPQTDFPGAEYISRHHFCLPLYPGMSEPETTYVVDSLQRTLSELRGG